MKTYLTSILLNLTFLVTSAQPCTPIVTPQLSETSLNEFEAKLATAKQAYEKDSTNAEALIWYGRRTAYLGRYMEAIDIFSRGIRLHPTDARFYRHRGHRYITVRCFDQAIVDLAKATTMIKGRNDETELDGLPNAQNIPTSTLHSNIWYHLGLAYFIKGEHKKAANALENCLAVSKNDDMYVATFNWAYLNLLRLKKFKEAEELYNSVNRNAELIENFDYWKVFNNIYVDQPYESEIDAKANLIMKDASLTGIATISYAIGCYCLVKGYKEKARSYFEKAIQTNQWSSFGFIAAEAELSKQK